MQLFQLDTLGTKLRIQVDTPHSCEGVFSEIRAMLLEFDKKYSRFIPGNWLDTLNRSGGGELDADSKIMLDFSLELARQTHGIFDPTIGTRLTQLGYGSRETVMFGGPPDVTFQDILVHGYTVRLERGACIEFGGVGKGYALDKIVHILKSYPRFLIDFGGDIYGKGGWNIGLEDPDNFTQVIGTVFLNDGFFCSSAGSRRKFGNSHHLLDALTGMSAHHISATYIESLSGMHADGYATACFITPLELSLKLFTSERISGVLLDANRTVYRTETSQIQLF